MRIDEEVAQVYLETRKLRDLGGEAGELVIGDVEMLKAEEMAQLGWKVGEVVAVQLQSL